jgi:hypothetical protein
VEERDVLNNLVIFFNRKEHVVHGAFGLESQWIANYRIHRTFYRPKDGVLLVEYNWLGPWDCGLFADN